MKDSEAGLHERIPRWLFLLVAAVLALGTVLAWWGTRGERTFPNGPRAAVLVSGTAPLAPLPSSAAQALADAPQLHTQYCAGCHDPRARLIGPSYEVIAASYQSLAKQRSGKLDALALLTEGITHPQPGWDNYQPGPSHSVLSSSERATVAQWILQGAPPAKITAHQAATTPSL